MGTFGLEADVLMVAKVSVEVRGIDEFISKVGGALSPEAQATAVDQAGALLLNRIRTRFLAETDPDGQKWVQSRSARRREQSGRGGGTLFDTGRLFNSIQFFKTQGGVASIGTDVPYSEEHQLGTKGQIQRVFLGFNAEDVSLTEDIVARAIQRGLDRA